MSLSKQFEEGLLRNHLTKVKKSFLRPYLVRKNRALPPSFISLTLANYCFFRCKQCNIWKNPQPKKLLSPRQITTILRSLKDWLGPFQLSLADGEPFLHPDILEVFRIAAKLGIFTQVNTNGYLLTETLCRKVLRSGVGAISFSLDSLTPKTHNFIRGNKKAFERVEAAADAFVKFRGENKFPHLTLTTIILRQNLDELKKMVWFVKEKGLDGIHFQPLTHTFYPHHYDPLWFKKSSLWPSDCQKVSHTLDALIALKKQGLPIENSEFQLKQYKQFFKNADRYGRQNHCNVGFESFLIDNYGNVRFCFEWPPVGNVFEENPAAIWQGESAQQQRAKILDCPRDCKVLICNMPMSRQDAVRFLFSVTTDKLKRGVKKLGNPLRFARPD